MGLIDRVRACNTYRSERFRPLLRNGERLGRIRHDNAELLRRFPAVFAVSDATVELTAPGDFAAVTDAVEGVIATLAAEDRVDRWRHEYFGVAPRWQAPPAFKLDRGAVSFFGVRSYGVHLNGWRAIGAETMLWIGRRAADKKVSPNKLDNMVAGGIGFGHGARETLVKEAQEEAALPPEIVARARPVGALSYRMEMPQGMRDDVLFVYDLEVPDDFTPRNTDGEIAEFTLMPARAMLERVRTTEDIKFNVNLVLIDFAIRHGLLAPEDLDYLELCGGLRHPPD
jgi:8-oxo-dGTP pyrophosphatase MutT (NUDIX family)